MSARSTTVHDLIAFEGAQIDVSDCNRLEICIALYEHEKAGARIETWPGPVKAQLEHVMTQWWKRNPGRIVKLVSSGRDGNTCVVIIHHCSAAAGEVPASAGAAAEAAASVTCGVSSPPVTPPPADRCTGCGD